MITIVLKLVPSYDTWDGIRTHDPQPLDEAAALDH